MKFSDAMLLSLVVLAGCREWDRRPGTAADSVVSGTGDQTTTSPKAGGDRQAPVIIPAITTTLNLIEQRKGQVEEGTVASYRNQVGRLVDAVLTDLNRAGRGDDGTLRSMGDSAVSLVGGGAGDAPEAKPEDILKSAATVRQILDIYQQRMREAGA
jgi:hypothetical protein